MYTHILVDYLILCSLMHYLLEVRVERLKKKSPLMSGFEHFINHVSQLLQTDKTMTE